jgi:L-iditol 2-dehydrogenase
MSSHYLAAEMTAPKTVTLVQAERRALQPGQVRLQVLQCGICGSEMNLWHGRVPEELPADIGHEFAGEVVEVAAEVRTPRVGDRVAAWVPTARGFADEAVVEARHCFPVSTGVPYPSAAEPLACVVNTVRAAAPAPGDHTVVIGAGFMALLTVMLTTGWDPGSLIVASRREGGRALAERVGATHVADYESLQAVVNEVTEGRGADVVYEFTGYQAGLNLALPVPRMSGKLVIGGFHQGGLRQLDLGDLNWRAIKPINAHFRDEQLIMKGMRDAADLMNRGLLDPTPLIGPVFTLGQIQRAFEAAETAEGKVVVAPQATSG